MGRSIEVLSANALPFLALAAVLQGPQLLWVAFGGSFTGTLGGDASLPAMLSLLLPLLLLSQIQAGFAAPGVARGLSGEPVRLRHCLPRSLTAFARILVGAGFVAVAAALGFLFLLLPGWIVLTGFFVALPALAIEEISPSAALGLSWRLAAKGWISLFALVFMFTVLERLLSLALVWLGAPLLVSALPAIPISALQAVTAGVAYLRLREGDPPGVTPART